MAITKDTNYRYRNVSKSTLLRKNNIDDTANNHASSTARSQPYKSHSYAPITQYLKESNDNIKTDSMTGFISEGAPYYSIGDGAD